MAGGEQCPTDHVYYTPIITFVLPANVISSLRLPGPNAIRPLLQTVYTTYLVLVIAIWRAF